ncbi:hypothetical protein [Brachybacterium alimentarium]|uniref:Uncharacterized protein n=1 Tax=Brachybacterium alimentarium TaxID=47845 RepID=A0A2A3YL24_9MICO|nr:hypothetical protein [Brachybacterium alimentarium]PCC31200.1 hypothetical protein CIK71_15075 [Brachybacterium alimentarium]PCC39981.1 hypothetical protein CIK66_04785 [Brachybacterium alimentarium]RCS71245.1 hypothetical protein CIK68_09570 [Brachybacterium alimentarium]RCS84337.1 hypothetical protein CIK67_10245 [Brachybacterium alimentarium]
MAVAPLLGADAVASPTDAAPAAPAAPAAARCREATAGPDADPEVACTIGGVIANNSSGMAAGLHGDTAARRQRFGGARARTRLDSPVMTRR